MLSKFAPRAFAAPVRYTAPVRATAISPVVRRSVTTDAASSHAEKSDVPAVRVAMYPQVVRGRALTGSKRKGEN